MFAVENWKQASSRQTITVLAYFPSSERKKVRVRVHHAICVYVSECSLFQPFHLIQFHDIPLDIMYQRLSQRRFLLSPIIDINNMADAQNYVTIKVYSALISMADMACVILSRQCQGHMYLSSHFEPYQLIFLNVHIPWLILTLTVSNLGVQS